jgi:hypothetical protein
MLVAASLLLLASFLVMPGALAGTTGTVSGIALDTATKAPIAGAKVTISGPSALQSTTTDKTGHFTFASLPPDTYTVTLEAPGYATATLNGVEVAADNLLNVTLSANTSGSS